MAPQEAAAAALVAAAPPAAGAHLPHALPCTRVSLTLTARQHLTALTPAALTPAAPADLTAPPAAGAHLPHALPCTRVSLTLTARQHLTALTPAAAALVAAAAALVAAAAAPVALTRQGQQRPLDMKKNIFQPARNHESHLNLFENRNKDIELLLPGFAGLRLQELTFVSSDRTFLNVSAAMLYVLIPNIMSCMKINEYYWLNRIKST